MTDIGTFIYKKRKEHGWSREILAALAKCSTNTIFQLERHGNVTLYTLRSVADVLGYELKLVKKHDD